MPKRYSPFYALALAVLVAMSVTLRAHAEEQNAWHAESESYRAYLGVVPANLIKRRPVLVDGDRTLHGGAGQQSGAAHHVMVALYRKSDNSRVTGATMIAEVGPARLLGGSNQEKPLERMATTGGITYGNYFEMPKPGKYEIEVHIYETDRNGNEKMEFTYVRP